MFVRAVSLGRTVPRSTVCLRSSPSTSHRLVERLLAPPRNAAQASNVPDVNSLESRLAVGDLCTAHSYQRCQLSICETCSPLLIASA